MKEQSFLNRNREFRRAGLTLVEVLVVIGILVLLVCLLLPMNRGAGEAARRNSCVNNAKQIGLAIHNHHDVYKRFPNLTTTAIRDVHPGSVVPDDDAHSAGYSWLVRILPYMEEVTLYGGISKSGEKFKRPAFDPEVVDESLAHLKDVGSSLRCPSFSGPELAGAPEYSNLPGMFLCNYVALSATDLSRMMSEQNEKEGANGCIVPKGQKINFRDIKDGTSKTLMCAESREVNYASWYDGTVNWVVGANPNDPPPKISDDLLIACGKTALAVRPEKNDKAYLPKTLNPSIAQDWQWGPSSEHSGDVIIHCVADGSVRSITDDIDPTLYLQLISRAGKEPANLPD